MSRYSLKNLLLEIDTLVGAPDAGDPYVYRRKDDGWYTRNRDWPASRDWAFLDPKKPNFAKAIEKLNKAYPQYAFDISKITPKSQETQKSMTAAPKSTSKGDFLVIRSKKIPGNFLSTKTVQALTNIVEGNQPMLDEESSITSDGTRALLAAQYILDFPQDPAWSPEFEEKVKKFQSIRPNLKYKSDLSMRATSFGDDDTYGKIDAETANELLSRSPAAMRLLGRIPAAPAPNLYAVGSETLQDPEGLIIMPEVKEKALIDAQNLKPGSKVGKLTLDLDALRAGQTCKVALCSVEWCAQYVAEVFRTPAMRADAGDAWTQHSIDAASENRLKFSGFMNLDKPKIELVTKAYRLSNRTGSNKQISQIVGKLVPSQDQIKSQLALGDIVGLYNPGSTFFSTAVHAAGAGRFYDPATDETSSAEIRPDVMWEPDTLLKNGTGFGMNTHLGFVGAMLDGTPIIFHNIHREVFATPVSANSDYPVLWAKSPEQLSL
jgi:hypothetical protein